VSVNNIKRFAYRLEGFNENWVKTSESNPNITYNSLRAGTYLLRVRILKGDGTLGEEESTLEITIRPPLWRTRWMILLYMLAIAGIAWWWRRRFLKQQNEKMELEQLRREAEKRQWMSNMRKQMLQEQTEMTASTEKTDKEPVQRDIIENGEHVVIFKEEPQNDLQLSLQTSDIVAFIKAKCDSFKAPEGKKVRITFFPLVNEADVAFDKVQMERALDNLLGNSVQFSPSECRIKIFVDKKDDKVQINISDNGIGVPDEAKPHMFDHLMDEDDGVNLYIVKDIITAHGGTITGDDNPGGGTLMSITLPSADVEVEEAVFMDDDE
jgi:C4-dicarboxylate-specific signal transduction histidine kinase